MAWPLTAAEISFGPVKAQPGQSIRMVSKAECAKGSIEWEKNGDTTRGSLTVLRERELSWTFREPAADGSLRGMVSVAGLSTVSSVTLGGKEEKTEDVSPLVGKMFAMTRSTTGEWKFELDGSVPQQRTQKEIDELTLYLKRKWYPTRKVTIGDSWEFDPSWIRMIIEKDFQKAQTIGTMKLRQIRHMVGKDLAVMDVSVRSTGGDFQADGSESRTQVELTGQTVVNLATMLDESLELKGVVTSSSGRVGDSKKATMPVSLVVTKSFVRAVDAP